MDFHGWVIKKTEELQCCKYLIFEKISEICRVLFSSCVLKLYGSQATGLALPDSDIDIAVLNAGVSFV
jgi:DNA polymerase sigma